MKLGGKTPASNGSSITPINYFCPFPNSSLWSPESPYPMDFYANKSLGPWTPNHKSVNEVSKQKTNKNKTCQSCECNENCK